MTSSLLSIDEEVVVILLCTIKNEKQIKEYDDMPDDLESPRGVPAWIEWTTIYASAQRGTYGNRKQTGHSCAGRSSVVSGCTHVTSYRSHSVAQQHSMKCMKRPASRSFPLQ